jgi:hypothetical protein
MTVEEPVTAAGVLWGRPEEVLPAAVRALYHARVSSAVLTGVGPLAVQTYDVLDHGIAEALRGQLDVDLGALVVRAWRGYGELLAVARRTRDAPGRPEDVALAEHEVAMVLTPTVEVRVDGAAYSTVAFDLDLAVRLHSVVVAVDHGAVIGHRGGDAVADVRLSLQGVTLAAAQRRLRMGELVPLGGGVPLVARVAPRPGGPVPRPGGPVPEPRGAGREQAPAG